MEQIDIDEPYSANQFVEAAKAYLETLKGASDFQEVVDIQRSTSIPYLLEESDLYSTAYRNEVLSVYNQLTGCSYDVKNEWTSTLQAPEDFEHGYPWVSGNYAIIAEEIAKPIQILRALHEIGRAIVSH